MSLKVSCDTGDGDRGGPHFFSLGGRVFTVTRVIDHWPGLDHRYYKVEVEGGDVYVLRQDLESLAWELIVFDATSPRAT